MSAPKYCPLCAIAHALEGLADLAHLIEDDNDVAHDKLKQTGDELCVVLDFFTETDEDAHAVRHWHERKPTQH